MFVAGQDAKDAISSLLDTPKALATFSARDMRGLIS